MLYLPDDTKAITVSVFVREDDGNMFLKTVAVDTQQIIDGKDVDIEIEEVAE